MTTSPSDSVPAGVRAILDALRFDRSPAALPELSTADLAFADREHLTPLLTRFPLPPVTKTYADAALARNTIRMQRFRAAYDEMADKFDHVVDHVVLKGFTHAPDFIDDIRLRAQYDLDLYVPTAHHDAARDALLALGYEPIGSMEGLPMDHLPTMIRKTGWEWRGDYYDPDLPAGVEVHFRFWDAPTECIRAEGLDDFWTRREGHQLDRVDMLGYAALHLTRHLLRGNVRVFHVWELANFLNMHQDPAFWRQWQKQHSLSLRQIQAIAFLLAKAWFGCRVADDAEAEIGALSPAVHRWFELYAWSPLESGFRPNKDELWLHMSLLESAGDRWSVLRRRLFPTSSPGPVASIHTPDDQLTFALRASRTARNLSYTASRAWFHARTLLPTLMEGARWWFRARE